MGEWLKPAVLKTVDGETRPGVRIPLPPPIILIFPFAFSRPNLVANRTASACPMSPVFLWKRALDEIRSYPLRLHLRRCLLSRNGSVPMPSPGNWGKAEWALFTAG
jgi:hypothetical protein